MRIPNPLTRQDHTPPLWREAGVWLEAASLLRDPIFKGDGVSDGRGQPVLLVPGFLAGDDSLGLMTRWLRRTGHHTRKAGIRANVDCSAVSAERLAERLQCLADSTRPRGAIIRPSRRGHNAEGPAGRP